MKANLGDIYNNNVKKKGVVLESPLMIKASKDHTAKTAKTDNSEINHTAKKAGLVMERDERWAAQSGGRACGAELLTEIAITKNNVQRFMSKYMVSSFLSYGQRDAELMGNLYKTVPYQDIMELLNVTQGIPFDPTPVYKKWKESPVLSKYPDFDQRLFFFVVRFYKLSIDYMERWTACEDIIRGMGRDADIFSFNDRLSVHRALNFAEEEKQRREMEREVKANAAKYDIKKDIVYQDDTIIAVKPSSYHISRLYFGAPTRTSILDGKKKEGATWCTASTDGSFFENYTKKLRYLIYFIRKKDDQLFALAGTRASQGKRDTLVKQIKNSLTHEKFVRDVYSQLKREERTGTLQSSQFLIMDMLQAFIDYQIAPYMHIQPGYDELRDQNNDMIESPLRFMNAIYDNQIFGATIYHIMHMGDRGEHKEVHIIDRINQLKDRVQDTFNKVSAFVERFLFLPVQEQSAPKTRKKVRQQQEQFKERVPRNVIKETGSMNFGFDRFRSSIGRNFILLNEVAVTENNIARIVAQYEYRNKPNFPARAYRDEQKKSTEYPQTAEEILQRIRISPVFARLYQPAAELAKEIIERFNTVQQRIKDIGGIADIFGYPNYVELVNAIYDSESAIKSNKALADAKRSAGGIRDHIILETDKVIAIRPPTWEMSYAYFGPHRRSLLDGKNKKGARWCTSASIPDGPEMFKDYTTKGNIMVYFINKSNDDLRAIRINFEQNVWAGGQDREAFHDYVKQVTRQLSAQADRHTDKENPPWRLTWKLIMRHSESVLPLIEVRDMNNTEIDFTEILYQFCDSLEECLDFIDKTIYRFERER